MNTQNNTLFGNLTQTETKVLTTVIAETLATSKDQAKVFTANDMWNIRRNKKRFSFRRQYA